MNKSYLEQALKTEKRINDELKQELEEQKKNNTLLIKENLAVYKENKDLRFENEEQSELINRIERFVNSNKYNNEKVILRTIKELISDHKSQN